MAQPVHIIRFRLEAYHPPLADFVVECSSGTYIRSLAHDLGQILGCGAHLSSLRRISSGEFVLADAHPLDELDDLGRDGAWEKFVTPIENLLPEFPVLTLDVEGENRARHGNLIFPAHIAAFPAGQTPPVDDPIFRLFGTDGRLLALARRSAEGLGLAPFLVISSE